MQDDTGRGGVCPPLAAQGAANGGVSESEQFGETGGPPLIDERLLWRWTKALEGVEARLDALERMGESGGPPLFAARNVLELLMADGRVVASVVAPRGWLLHLPDAGGVVRVGDRDGELRGWQMVGVRDVTHLADGTQVVRATVRAGQWHSGEGVQ